ncbi:MAG TPA: dTDP-4-dehydrorhamnose reductase [Caulobacteraceae bacterium]|nr:dTDP-4-dehydrorhamnose reductase [Caulobacteraceae bacterium]
MKALVTGAAGQVGRAWAAAAPDGWRLTALARAELDIGDGEAVRRSVERLAPDLILSAAAYTAVDRAESEAEAAFRVNRDGAAHLARAAQAIGARLIHLSTDFVFDGAAGRPYRPDDATGPLGVYGASKLAGEQAVLEALPEALIVRSAWIYGPEGSNFLATMLRLMRSGGEVSVVADQIGAPTSVLTLAPALWSLAGTEASGVWHFTNAGIASWYDFAQAIAEEALAVGLLTQAPDVRPIATSDYPTPARRPSYSVLDCQATYARLGAPAPHWREGLRATLARMTRRAQ